MINQKKYVLKLLIDAGHLAYKPPITPFDNLVKLPSTGNVSFTNVQAYRRLIRRLIYLTNIRLNITFYVQQLSKFLDKPTIAHYNETFRILRYIKGAPNLGLFFSFSTSAHLKAFCDSEGDTCSDSRQLVIVLVCILRISLNPGNQRSKEQYQRALVKLNIGK